ncbi:hypothetical protein F5X99DRAFT_377194 [Biscogniauxia marginata]|nr:hypothetical protein F5X99DRAFT_377194 [Biscogniauxia marginata]
MIQYIAIVHTYLLYITCTACQTCIHTCMGIYRSNQRKRKFVLTPPPLFPSPYCPPLRLGGCYNCCITCAILAFLS